MASVQFALISAGQNFRRNLAISLAGVFTIGLILVMVGLTLMGTHFLNGLLQTQQQRAGNLKVYIGTGVSLASIENLQSDLGQRPYVVSSSLETKDQAAQELQASGGSQISQVLTILGNNPLPDSVNVTVKQLSDLAIINKFAENSPVVKSGTPTDYSQTVISKVEGIIFWIKVVGTGVSAILSFISLVIIMNTIRTAVFIRRTEIEIMKLVGATDWFVRWPFILEGILGGFLAAVFAGAIIAVAYNYGVSHIASALLTVPPGPGYLESLLGTLALAGILLGALGSYLGVRRFLAA